MANLSSNNNYLLLLNMSFNDSISFPSDAYCFFHGQSSTIFTTFSTTYILLLLPLCILILYRGLQKWRQKPCFSSVSVSHSDCFTYHTVIMELTGVFGCILCCCGVYKKMFNMSTNGILVFFFKWYGEVLFHILTCLERYLAVVHPITYLGLRSEKGIRIRNFTIACVWLLCLVWTYLCKITSMVIWDLCFLILALIVVSFCSVSVLSVLIQPGPVGQGEDRKRMDQTKQRAFFTIVSILGVVLLRVTSNLIWELVQVTTGPTECLIVASVFWFNLPSSLVLPALFLYRERKCLKFFQ